MVKKLLVAVVPFVLVVSACGGDSDTDPDVVEQGSAQSGGAEAGPAEGSPSEAQESAEQGQLVESGFGQDGSSAVAVVLVENTSDHGGQTVTVSVNFLDAAGEILATESQVDSFNHAGQTIASQVTAFDLGRSEVAAIEPTLLIEDEGTFDETDYELGTVEGTNLRREYGAWSGDFEVVNPTGEPLESPAVRVVCRDRSGTINGGGFTFPDLVPPNGRVVADVSLTLSSKPALCTAYIGGPIY